MQPSFPWQVVSPEDNLHPEQPGYSLPQHQFLSAVSTSDPQLPSSLPFSAQQPQQRQFSHVQDLLQVPGEPRSPGLPPNFQALASGPSPSSIEALASILLGVDRNNPYSSSKEPGLGQSLSQKQPRFQELGLSQGSWADQQALPLGLAGASADSPDTEADYTEVAELHASWREDGVAELVAGRTAAADQNMPPLAPSGISQQQQQLQPQSRSSLHEQREPEQDKGVGLRQKVPLVDAKATKAGRGRGSKARASGTGSSARLGALPERLKAKARQPKRAASGTRAAAAPASTTTAVAPAGAGRAAYASAVPAVVRSGSGGIVSEQQTPSHVVASKKQKGQQPVPSAVRTTRARSKDGAIARASKAIGGM